MENRRKNQFGDDLCIQRQLFVLKCVAAVLLPQLQFCRAVASETTGKGEYDKLFIFGDSFVDTGNRVRFNNTYTAIGRVNQNWQPPYGRTHPGDPAGRFSDGKVLSDHLAGYVGLNPRPYRYLNDGYYTTTRVEDGINFAVSGSGVFDNLGFTKTGEQIAQLTELLQTGLYTRDLFPKSLILYAISGNDYAAYRRNNGSSDVVSIIALVTSVVTQIADDLTSLYKLGFRSFVVGKLAPVGCMPFTTVVSNFSACDESLNDLTTLHNLNLYLVAESMPGAKTIFLNNQLAFAKVIGNASNPDRLKACCSGVQDGALCGDVNEAGRLISTLCGSNDTKSFFWWDEFHPTEAGWSQIFDLFLEGFPFLYTDGKSLPKFLGVDPVAEKTLPASKFSIKSP